MAIGAERKAIFSPEKDVVDAGVPYWMYLKPAGKACQSITNRLRADGVPEQTMRALGQVTDLVRGLKNDPNDWTCRLRLNSSHTHVSLEFAHGIGRFGAYTEDRLSPESRFASALVVEQGESIGRRQDGCLETMYFFARPLTDRRNFHLQPGIAFTRTVEGIVTAWIVSSDEGERYTLDTSVGPLQTKMTSEEFQLLWDKTIALQQKLAQAMPMLKRA